MCIILYRNSYMENDMPITNVDHRELFRQEGHGTTLKDGRHLCTFTLGCYVLFCPLLILCPDIGLNDGWVGRI